MEWTEIMKLLHYDPATGVFTRLCRTAPNADAGDVPTTENGKGYIRFRINKKKYYAHRVAWFYMTGEWPKQDIDHINGDTRDNRWANLRDVSTQVNCENQSRAQRDNKSTGLLGAHKCGDYFTATIQVK